MKLYRWRNIEKSGQFEGLYVTVLFEVEEGIIRGGYTCAEFFNPWVGKPIEELLDWANQNGQTIRELFTAECV